MNPPKVSLPASHLPDRPPQRRLLALLLLLLGTGLAGCESQTTLVRLGIFVAPLSTALMAIMLHGQALRFPIFVADAYRRPGVLAVPTIAMIISNIFLWVKLLSTGQDTKHLLQILSNGWFGLSLVLLAGLYIITIVVWRIWLALSPRTSYEGANILGSMLFLAPGVLFSHGIYTQELQPVLQWLTIYNVYALFIFPVLAIAIVVEAWYRQRAQARSR